jgi:hypothetical protein
MDQYDSRGPWSRDGQPESSTPIYDRLLAEWREAARSPQRPPGPECRAPAPPPGDKVSAYVPAARTAGGTGGGR